MKSHSSKLLMKVRRKRNKTLGKRVKKVGSRKNQKRNSKGMKKQKRKSRKYLRKRKFKSLGGEFVTTHVGDNLKCIYNNVPYHNVTHGTDTSVLAKNLAENLAEPRVRIGNGTPINAQIGGAWHDVQHPGIGY
jgi:hypothetical protein